MSRSFRMWLAEKIMTTDLKLTCARYHRLRDDLSSERWWLGKEFPEVHAYITRILEMDDNYARKLGEPANRSTWDSDIAGFREQMIRGEARSKLK